jgi:multiple sugar transport system permease protein
VRRAWTGGRWVGHALLAASVLVVLGPFVWILLASLKHQIAIYLGTWLFEPTLSNYAEILFSRRSDLATNVLNSMLVAGLSTALALVFGTLAAYSLQSLGWARWLSAGFLAWTIVCHAIPVITLLGPWYIAFTELGLRDGRLALVVTHLTINLPMTIWLMMAFFRDIPRELEEAALVDGCLPTQVFWKIKLPLVVPGLIAAGVLAFIFSWNEFPIALTLTSRETATVPVAIARFAQQYEVQHAQMAAASMISTVPALVLMFYGQRFVIRGLTLGSVK